MLRSDGVGQPVNLEHDNIPAGTPFQIGLIWSAAANEYQIGINDGVVWKWSQPAPFSGFSDSGFVGLLTNCPVRANVSRFEVMDEAPAPAEFETYFSGQQAVFGLVFNSNNNSMYASVI